MSDEGFVTKSEILPLLGVVKKQGTWTFAHCPSHPDGTKHGGKGGQSLGLSDQGVLKCFAGCSFSDVMAALRKRPTPLAARIKHDDRGWPQNPSVVYEYKTPNGELLAIKARFERPGEGDKPDKTFRWRLPEGTYKDGLGELKISDMPLWGAEELKESDTTRPVWFAEGESATAAIRKAGELATCGSWGASQRQFGNAFEVLRDRDVILWPDNDVAGREYMEAVRKHIIPIARSVVTVHAPVPPKGDAVEYFQAGGTIPDLLSKVLLRATVDVLDHDHYVVRIPSSVGPVAFEFTHLQKMGGSFDCELSVSLLSPGGEPEPYRQRINLMSSSARSQLETALGRQFGKQEINWTTITSTAYARVSAAFLETDRAVQVGQLPTVLDQNFLVDVLLPWQQPAVIFADGSSGKTLIAYSLALAVALGGTFCGLNVLPGGVLIVDYESSMTRFRMERLLAGMGNGLPLDKLPIHYWDGRGVPLVDQTEALIRTIKKLDITFVIVDSGGAACGGEPEKAVIALDYFNALSRLRTTTLTICHVAKGESEASTLRPFGSAFWHNMARRTWFVMREQEEESDDMEVTLINRKVNDGRRPRPISLSVHFDGDSGPITITRAEFRDVEAAANKRVGVVVADYLTSIGEPATIAQIASATHLANESVKSVLNRGRGVAFEQLPASGAGAGRQATWRVM